MGFKRSWVRIPPARISLIISDLGYKRGSGNSFYNNMSTWYLPWLSRYVASERKLNSQEPMPRPSRFTPHLATSNRVETPATQRTLSAVKDKYTTVTVAPDHGVPTVPLRGPPHAGLFHQVIAYRQFAVEVPFHAICAPVTSMFSIRHLSWLKRASHLTNGVRHEQCI